MKVLEKDHHFIHLVKFLMSRVSHFLGFFFVPTVTFDG